MVKSTTASVSPKATGAVHFTMGSVASMVGTSHRDDGVLSMAKVEVKVGTSALKRTTAEHNPPARGSASGRIKFFKLNWKRSRQRLQPDSPRIASARTLEAITRRRMVSSEGTAAWGSLRKA